MTVDSDLIDALAVEYYEWLAGHGGRDPRRIAKGLRPVDLKAYAREVDRVNLIWSVTGACRGESAVSGATLLGGQVLG
jgi:hypothetical protein